MDEHRVQGHLGEKFRTKITKVWWKEFGENMLQHRVQDQLAEKFRTNITNSWWNEVGENVLQWMRIDGSESHRSCPLVVLLVNMLVQPAHTKTLYIFPFQKNIKLFFF